MKPFRPALLAAVLAGALALGACTPGAQHSPAPSHTLVVAADLPGAVTAELGEAFRHGAGAEVTFVERGEPADVVQVDPGRGELEALAPTLMDLTEYAQEYRWEERIDPRLLALMRLSPTGEIGLGTRLALPVIGETTVVYYSRAVVEEYVQEGSLDSWTGVLGAIGTVAAEEGGSLACDSDCAVRAFGLIQAEYAPVEEIVPLALGNDGGRWQSDANFMSAIELHQWMPLLHSGRLHDARDALELFTAGNAAFLIGSSALAPQLEEAMAGDVGAVVPHAQIPAVFGGVQAGFGVSTEAQDADLAAAFVDFLAGPEAAQVLADAGYLPVTGEGPAEGLLLGSVAEQFTGAVAGGHVVPHLWWASATMAQTLTGGVEGVLGEELSPERFLQQIQEDYSTVVDSRVARA